MYVFIIRCMYDRVFLLHFSYLEVLELDKIAYFVFNIGTKSHAGFVFVVI